MKQYLVLFLLLLPVPLFSIGYNANIEFGAGVAESVGSDQIEHNKNLWDNFAEAANYLSFSGGISADIILSQSYGAEVGLKFKTINLNYVTQKNYANDEVHLNFSVIQIPVLYKYSIPVVKTVDVVSALSIAGGINVSAITGSQTYSDSITRDNGKFITPIFDVGATVKVTYSHKIGPGKAFIGLNADVNFIPQSYKISGYDFSIGNIVTVSPVIGYTFIIQEDKGLAKITEKNKRIKDIDVK